MMADILVVDDDETLGELMRELLESLGHSVRVVHDGREGLRALDQRFPDLIILDVEMPLLDGPGMAYQMLLTDAGREKIPVLLSSGYADLQKIVERVGTPYFVHKPCTVPALVSMIERALCERTAPAPRPPPPAG
jgi:CheY-like chemotaxis protein